MKRMSLASSLIQKFDKSLKERILGANISKEALNKFREKEKKDSVKILTDLLDLKSKSESEVYEVLNTMVKNSQFFMYCGPLLLNINPGPNNIRDYLNLQSWIKETENGRVAVRSVRKDTNNTLKALEKDGLTEDESKKGQEEVQKLTDRFVADIDKISQAKEAEIMTV